MTEWKPGDVALRTGPNGQTTMSFVVVDGRYRDCSRDGHGKGPHWHHADGGWNTIPDDEKYGTYRRLVVIDPEDREQVERLASIYYGKGWHETYLHARPPMIDAMQAALREFANPTPRIEEPKGWLAVVEDADQRRYFRHDIEPDMPWRERTSDPVSSLRWSDINAVRIVSEGVADD